MKWPWAKKDKPIGKQGEDLAAKHLKSKGFAVSDRNWRCAIGEIDIVARKGGLLAIVEVKTRSSDRYGSPQSKVTAYKQKRLTKLAQAYMKAKKPGPLKVRFDVIAVTIIDGEKPQIVHIPSAFQARGI